MSENEIFERFFDSSTRSIWGYMYGKPKISTFVKGKLEMIPDKLIEIGKSEVKYVENNAGEKGLLFVWGYPGPDCNFYKLCDYGKTWAFTKDEIVEPT